MKIGVKILHFTEGIVQLRGAMSISNGKVAGGPKTAEAISRIPGGYLIKFEGKLIVVEAAQVKCAEVEDLDAEPTKVVASAPTPPAALPSVSPIPTPTPAPGDVVVDGRGVYSRVPLSTPPSGEVAPAAEEEPSPDRPAHQLKRQERTRRVGPAKE